MWALFLPNFERVILDTHFYLLRIFIHSFFAIFQTPKLCLWEDRCFSSWEGCTRDTRVSSHETKTYTAAKNFQDPPL